MADEELITSEIYNILSNPAPSEEDLNKVKDFISKAGSPWLAGVPEDFMAFAFPKYSRPVELGKFDERLCNNLANITKNLQEIGATDVLQHFLNDSNTPNGDSAVTYLALHALSAQHKADRGIPEFEAYKDAQINLLKTLADLKDAEGNNIVNFATENKHEKNLKGLAKTYTDVVASRNASLPAGSAAIQDPARELEQFFARVDEDAEKYQTNIGSLEETTERTPEQLPETVVNAGEELKKDKNPSKMAKDYHTRDIKPKDVIDFMYEDVFLHYLNLWTDKLIGYMRNGVDRYAEWCKRSGDELDRATEKMKNADCKAGARKIAALFNQTAPQMDAEYEVKMNRLLAINDATKENIRKYPDEPDKWTWKDSAGNDILSPQIDADGNMNDDAKIIKLLKDEYAHNPSRLKDAVNNRTPKDIEIEKSLHKLAVRNAMTKQAMKYMLDSKSKWIDAENPDFEKLVEAEMVEMRAAVLTIGAVVDDHANANGMTEAQKKALYVQSVQNFINLQIEQQTKTLEAITKDASNERFAFNNPRLLNMVSPKEIQITENMQRSLSALSQLYQDETGHTLKEAAEQYRHDLSGAAPLNVVFKEINQRQQNIDLSLDANHGRISRLERGTEDERAAKSLVQSILGGGRSS